MFNSQFKKCLQLTQGVILSKDVSIIELQTSEPKINAEVNTLGWGVEKLCSNIKDYILSDVLKIITLQTINETFCDSLWISKILRSNQICTIRKKEGEGVYVVSKTTVFTLNKYLALKQ